MWWSVDIFLVLAMCFCCSDALRKGCQASVFLPVVVFQTKFLEWICHSCIDGNKLWNTTLTLLFQTFAVILIDSEIATKQWESKACSEARKNYLVRAEWVRCPWALLRNKVSTIFGFIFLLFFFSATYFSPRRACPRVMKFCTEF